MVAHLKILILIAGITTAVYANSLPNSFHFDDQHYIVGNPYIRELSNIPSFFTSTKYSSFEKVFTGHYRPLLVTSYALNYALGGLNPAGYHVTNLLFHIGSVFLIFLILRTMLGSRRDRPSGLSSEQVAGSRHLHPIPPPPFLSKGGGRKRGVPATFIPLMASLLFAVHPFNSEVVNYITARSSVMCSFFYLLSFYCWVRFRQVAGSRRDRPSGLSSELLPSTYFYIASLLSFILAMLTKEIAVTLPVMLFLYELYFHRVMGQNPPCPPFTKGGKGELRGIWGMAYLPYLLLVVVPYLTYRILVFGRIAGGGSRDFYTNLLTQPKVLLKYLQLLSLPLGLTIDHDIAISSTIHDISTLIYIIPLLLLLPATCLLLPKRGGEWRVLSFFILWFFITLLPTTLISLNAILQENRGYLSGIGFSLFAGICIGKFRQRISIPILLIVISLFSILTIQRNSVWRDDYTLWTDAVNKAPSSARAHDNLGLAYTGKGEYDLALTEFKKTLELHPRYYLAYYNAGVVYQLQNRLDMARLSYEECIRINPQYFRTYYNLGIVYKKMGDLDKAIGAYEKAISLDPRHPFVYNNVGIALTDKGEIDRAASVFKKAIEIDPMYEKAYFNLGNIYYRVGKYGLAVEAYRSALKIRSDYREAKEMLAVAMAKLSQ